MGRAPCRLFEIDIKFYFHGCLLITFLPAKLNMAKGKTKYNCKGESVKESRMATHKFMVTNLDIDSTLPGQPSRFVWSTHFSVILTY